MTCTTGQARRTGYDIPVLPLGATCLVDFAHALTRAGTGAPDFARAGSGDLEVAV